jgi:tRNA threonylcarbamoyladenosine biosynthesis protein TsaE
VRVVFYTSSAAETIELGRALASQLKTGDVVAFYGELGAGKTTMIKGVAVGLGVADVVKSPSFVIVTEYRGRFSGVVAPTASPSPIPPPSRGREQREGVPVYHIDLYRLDERSDFESIGLETYIDGDGVCLIEWADRAERVLPDTTIRVRMSVEGAGRRIEATGLRAPI